MANTLIISSNPEEERQTQRVNLGKRLAGIRKSIEMSQAAMADLLGVDQGTVSRWESGKWEGESIPRAYLLIYSILDGRRIPQLLAPRLNNEDTGFQITKKSDEDRGRRILVLEALGLIDPLKSAKSLRKPAIAPATSPAFPWECAEKVLVSLLFDALNGRPPEKGYGFLVDGPKVVKVRARTRTGAPLSQGELETVGKAQVIAWR